MASEGVVDINLRKNLSHFGVHEGFGPEDNKLRSEAWMCIYLSAIKENGNTESSATDSPATKQEHRQVSVDVQRSMTFTECKKWSEKKREKMLQKLQRVLEAVFPVHLQTQFPYYVQGTHDIASVLLLVLGERRATQMLFALITRGIKGFLQASVNTPMIFLKLLDPLLHALDPALAIHLHSFETRSMTPIRSFFLPWVLTWFSHSVSSVAPIYRLFDVFVSAHPLMPVYVAASLLHHPESSGKLLSISTLSDIVGYDERTEWIMVVKTIPELLERKQVVEEVIATSIALYKKVPPLALLSCLDARCRDILWTDWPELWTWYIETKYDPIFGPLQYYFNYIMSCGHKLLLNFETFRGKRKASTAGENLEYLMKSPLKKPYSVANTILNVLLVCSFSCATLYSFFCYKQISIHLFSE